MVARTRLLQRLRGLAGLWFLLALYTNGLPLLFHYLGKRDTWLDTTATVGRIVLFVGPPLIGGLAFLILRWVRQRQDDFHHRLQDEGRTVFLLPRPDAPPVKVDRVGLWSRLADVIPRDEHITFELAGGSEGVAFFTRSTEGVDRAILTQVMSEWPGTQARPVEKPEDDPLSNDGEDGERTGWWVEVQPTGTERPIVASVPDPLMAILTEVARLPEGVRGGLQVQVRGDPFTRRRLGKKAARLTAQRAAGKSLEQKRGEKGLDARAQRLFLEARLIVWAVAGTEEMARSVARSLARTLVAQFGPSNPLRKADEGAGAPTAREFPLFAGKPWADDELTAVAHLVGKDGRNVAPQLRVAPARSLPPSPESRVPRDARTVRK
ncbi:MAG: hypothetical protein DRI80_16620 [Chloroflexota bacterium]|nr:MAG: hypothetical protein DRI80_16620 [Chloroflexota bacterium]